MEWSILVLGFTAKGPVKHKSATLLENIIECASQGAFKIVGHSKWLLFGQVAPSRSITLLILIHVLIFQVHYDVSSIDFKRTKAARAN